MAVGQSEERRAKLRDMSNTVGSGWGGGNAGGMKERKKKKSNMTAAEFERSLKLRQDPRALVSRGTAEAPA